MEPYRRGAWRPLTHMKVEPINNQVRKAKRSPLALYIHDGWGTPHSNVLTLYNLIKDHRWRALSIFSPQDLSSFEIIFRHMVDHPHMSSFHLGAIYFDRKDDVTTILVKEALRQNLSITYLAAR
ncbi:hypothetical protein FRB94_000966 [Tulasnella sp. JGI-2019a]|nr:hypothetical protein FRB94_000966 [Tulasnella sp. JGI-2019a]